MNKKKDRTKGSDDEALYLSVHEKQALRHDMAESSAWARAELKRRREEKAKQNAEHGTNNGTTTEPSPKQP